MSTTMDGDVLQGHVRSVTDKDIGTVLAIDAAAGAVDLVVERTTDFPAAGAVMVNGQLVTYATLNTATRTITLDTGLTADAVAGDEVLLYDTELSAVAVEVKALVQPDGVGGDTIEAIVDHGLTDTLLSDSRDGDGESVLCRKIAGEWYLEKILGKVLVRDTVGRFATAREGARMHLIDDFMGLGVAALLIYTDIANDEAMAGIIYATDLADDVRYLMIKTPASATHGTGPSIEMYNEAGGGTVRIFGNVEIGSGGTLTANGGGPLPLEDTTVDGDLEVTGEATVGGPVVLENLADGAGGDAPNGARFCRVGDNGRLWASEDLPASLQTVIDGYESRISALEATVANHTDRLNNHRDELDDHESRIDALEGP